MEEVEIKKITEIDEDNLNRMTEWMYEWWGKEETLTFEQVKSFVKHSMQEDRLPQTYGAFIKKNIDLTARPDIYPWLANVYVDTQHRNKGICRKLLESVKENAKGNVNFNELWLYTKHIDLYEKFGWKYIKDIQTYNREQEIQRLYKLEL